MPSSFAISEKLRARFMSKVRVPSDSTQCWEWTGGGRGIGYGAFKIEGRAWDAHRVSFVLHKGPVGEGMVVMHTCDNRNCVNPNHLAVGTYSDNASDAQTKRRLSGFVRRTVLTDDEMRLLWDESSRGISNAELARKYRVPITSLSRVLRRCDAMFSRSPAPCER